MDALCRRRFAIVHSGSAAILFRGHFLANSCKTPRKVAFAVSKRRVPARGR